MNSKKMTIILSALIIIGVLALAGLYLGGQYMLDRQTDSADGSAAPELVDRIPGIPGERRTHRIAVDKSDYENSRVNTGDEEIIYSLPLNIDVEIVPAADAPLEDDDLVMGVLIAGEARAYPVNYMMGPYNEIVNDTVGGMPLAATW